jgi:hypothetical protein
MLIVEGGARLRAVLVDVYAALGIAWRAGTAAAADDIVGGVTAADAERTLVATLAAHERLTATDLDPSTVALAETLRAGHAR